MQILTSNMRCLLQIYAFQLVKNLATEMVVLNVPNRINANQLNNFPVKTTKYFSFTKLSIILAYKYLRGRLARTSMVPVN